MASEYTSFYRRDLETMINQVAIEAIRKADGNGEGVETYSCPLQARLKGIFDVVDGFLAKMNDEEG